MEEQGCQARRKRAARRSRKYQEFRMLPWTHGGTRKKIKKLGGGGIPQ
jgi:hypothetical protein